jgi:hypothetical protein
MFMHILPQDKQEWQAAFVFPFEAYTVIAPLMYWVFLHLCRNASYYRHYYPGDEAAYSMMPMLMFPCSAVLLISALKFARAGSKGNAWSCIGFCIAALIFGYYLLPPLAHA